MKAVIIDNYDSFTYNLYHLIRETGTDTTVLRNDAFNLKDIEAYDKIILSPGPGIPEEAGLLLDVIHTYAGRKPILGVCLGHQAIGQAFGAQLVNLSDVFHGVQTPCFQTEKDYIFQGIPKQFPVGRYHSWVVSDDGLPSCLEVTAVSQKDKSWHCATANTISTAYSSIRNPYSPRMDEPSWKTSSGTPCVHK